MKPNIDNDRDEACTAAAPAPYVYDMECVSVTHRQDETIITCRDDRGTSRTLWMPPGLVVWPGMKLRVSVQIIP